MEALREAGKDGHGVGLEPSATLATLYQPPAQSYMEALQKLRILDCAQGLGSLGASSEMRSGGAVSGKERRCGEGGKGYVGFNKEMVLRALSGMQSQISEFLKNINGLIRVVEMDEGWGWE